VNCLLLFRVCECNELSFNDVIDSLPTDTFVKVFFEGDRPYEIFETRVPILLVHHTQDWYLKSNRTTLCKFFHVRRIIGSRTNYVVNLVQIDTKQPLFSLGKYPPEFILMMMRTVDGVMTKLGVGVNECNWLGSITQTIIIGNNAVYEMFTKHLTLFINYLHNPNHNYAFRQNVAFLFRLGGTLPYWKMCIVFEDGSKNTGLCLDSPTIIHDTFEREKMLKMAFGDDRGITNHPIPFVYTARQRKLYFMRSLEEILENELLFKYNATYHFRGYYGISLRTVTSFQLDTDSVVLLDDTATNFLSCYTTPVLSFKMYVQPFQFELWFCIVSIISTIAIFIYIYNRKRNLSPSFSPFFFFASTLVEEPYSVPTALWNDSKFRMITIAWLLTAMIFTNLYSGQMITDVSVPLKGDILHSLEQVFGPYHKVRPQFWVHMGEDLLFWSRNYTSYWKPGDESLSLRVSSLKINYSHFDTYHQQFRKIDHFALLQAPHGGDSVSALEEERLVNPHMYKFFDKFWYEAFMMSVNVKGFNLKYVYYISNLISPKHRHYPKDPQFPSSKAGLIQHYRAAAVEKELTACGKSIFIADLKELGPELDYLQTNYPDRTFYRGNSTIEQGRRKKVFWNYSLGGNRVLAHYLKCLLQAGISSHITSIANDKKYLERRIGTKIIKEMERLAAAGMDMSGSIQTIFIISAGILVLASCVFLFECMATRRKTNYIMIEQFFLISAVKVRWLFMKLIKF
jgi:hypothetical protein